MIRKKVQGLTIILALVMMPVVFSGCFKSPTTPHTIGTCAGPNCSGTPAANDGQDGQDGANATATPTPGGNCGQGQGSISGTTYNVPATYIVNIWAISTTCTRQIGTLGGPYTITGLTPGTYTVKMSLYTCGASPIYYPSPVQVNGNAVTGIDMSF